jgi:hypothetical protein
MLAADITRISVSPRRLAECRKAGSAMYWSKARTASALSEDLGRRSAKVIPAFSKLRILLGKERQLSLKLFVA